jgi:hypothetical protein
VHRARAGLGLTALPCFLGARAPELVRVLAPEPSLAGELRLLAPPGGVRAFMEARARGIRRERALLEGDAT